MPFYILRSEGKGRADGGPAYGVVAEGDRGRVYLWSRCQTHEEIAKRSQTWKPDGDTAKRSTGFRACQEYGLTNLGDLFTPRQLVALTTFSDLVAEAMERVERDAANADLPNDERTLRDGGTGATAYAEATRGVSGVSC